jgi:hypothetical protein
MRAYGDKVGAQDGRKRQHKITHSRVAYRLSTAAIALRIRSDIVGSTNARGCSGVRQRRSDGRWLAYCGHDNPADRVIRCERTILGVGALTHLTVFMN